METKRDLVQETNGRSQRVLGIISVVLVVLGALIGTISIILMDSGVSLSVQAVLDGSAAGEFAKKFENDIPVRESSIDFMGSVRYNIFREGQRGVLVGKEGYLFTAEEYELEVEGYGIEDNVLHYISEVHSALTEQGVKLLVIPIPSKSRILGKYLARFSMPHEIEKRYSSFLNYLEQLDVEYADINSAYENTDEKSRLYYKRDTHWTAYGAKLAADSVKRIVDRIVDRTSIPDREYFTETVGVESFIGDLVQYLPGAFSNEDDSYQEEHKIIVLKEQNPPVTGLFDDPVIPYALVGTSYSNDTRWGFRMFLQEALQGDFLDLSSKGKGPFEPMKNFIDSDYIAENGIQMVLWEIPERYIPIEDLLSFRQDKR